MTEADEERFPTEVRAVLLAAGWAPGRDVGADIDPWLERLTGPLRGVPPPAAARAALAEFGGLVLPAYGPGGRLGGGWSTTFHPSQGRLRTEAVAGFGERLGLEVFPIGFSADDHADIAMDALGRVFLLHWVDDFFVADGIDEAVVTVVRGRRHRSYPRVRADGTW